MSASWQKGSTARSVVPSRQHDRDAQASRTHKRPRLDPDRARTEENASHDVSRQRNVTSRAEVAMMEDLLAGLEASAFEGFEVSPAKPRQLPRPTTISPSRRPFTPRRHVVSQTSPLRLAHPGPKMLVGRKSPCKQSPSKRIKASPELGHAISVKIGPKVESVKPLIAPPLAQFPSPNAVKVGQPSPKDVGPVKLEDDEFDFGFDLAELADIDEKTLMEGPPSVRYPILNPDVPGPPPDWSATPWSRYSVDAVFDGIRQVDESKESSIGLLPPAASERGGKTLMVSDVKQGIRRIVHLKERWADTEVQAGDTINLISPLVDGDAALPIVISLKDPSCFMIHHPDLMLTMTSIANAMPCPRKPILQSLVKVAGPPSKAVLYGNIQHSLLQSALSEQSFSEEDTRRRLDAELAKETTRLELWGMGMDIEEVRRDLGTRAGKGFETFGKKWVGPDPSLHGQLHSLSGEDAEFAAINGLHEIEEDIWSPKWGLKGKVDASVQAKILRTASKAADADENVSPLEIKTGRAVGVMAHRAQTMLYTLLMEDRYGVPVPAGLLYYSQLDSILRVEARPNEIRALMMARNELAGWLAKQRGVPREAKPDAISATAPDMEEGFLPPTIDHVKECRSCYAVDTCMLYRKTAEAAPPKEEDPIAELYEEKTGHLNERDAAFHTKWDTLITVEEQDIGRFRSQLWTMTAKAREKSGRCFSDMVIESYSNDVGKSLSKIHRHSYTLVRSKHVEAEGQSLLSGHIAKGDPVSLSIEPDLLCLSRGFVTDLSAERITVGVTYVIDTAALLKRTRLRGHHVEDAEVRFRIDKDEMASGMMRMRNNLAQLFFVGGDEKRRQLLVHLETPRFEPARAPLEHEIPTSFNSDQRNAMSRVLTARDYALILGMPGTGKTTTIAAIIKTLVARGKSVLLTSYTHSAVDTILLKLRDADFGILRLGNVDKVLPDVQHFTLDSRDASQSMTQLNDRLMGPPVVAATCLAIDHPLFFRRKFDYCVVDEASQITLPTCLGPLRMADTFVLVGDHFQLPPIVKNAEARRGGLDVSLFRMLSEAHPTAVVDLSHQYRMNEDIMLLSNHLIYENRLQCGSEEVKHQALILPSPKACHDIWSGGESRCGERACWLQGLMSEKIKAVFVDTDLVPARDSRVGDLVQNPNEAKLVYQLASGLVSAGIQEDDIAVITPYRQQIKLLTGLFGSMPKVEILTADRSQGRDKDCILISLVRSNETGNIGDLLRDWRRINVSFTRAKRKLVIFGSRSTLQSDRLLADFFKLMDDKEWIYTLPVGATDLHPSPAVGAVAEPQPLTERVKAEDSGPGKGRIGERVLAGRPLLREVLRSDG